MKPLLKWVGGKTQILEHIMRRFPKKMGNYHEIFLGGGSVLLKVIEMKKYDEIDIKGKIYASDKNENLIDFYHILQKYPKELCGEVQKLFEEYSQISDKEVNRRPKTSEEGKTSKESFYYWKREQYNNPINQTLIQRASIFLFLNRMGFRGLYREGSNGFNVPFGHYKKSPKLVEEDFICMSEHIKDVIFYVSDFKESLKKAKKGDFIYLDPPYVPEKKNSFVGYTSDRFVEHEELFKRIELLRKEGIHVVLSNAKVKMIIDFFSNGAWGCDEISARRSINSKDPSSKTTEILIY